MSHVVMTPETTKKPALIPPWVGRALVGGLVASCSYAMILFVLFTISQ